MHSHESFRSIFIWLKIFQFRPIITILVLNLDVFTTILFMPFTSTIYYFCQWQTILIPSFNNNLFTTILLLPFYHFNFIFNNNNILKLQPLHNHCAFTIYHFTISIPFLTTIIFINFNLFTTILVFPFTIFHLPFSFLCNNKLV